jgi:putative DNA primase/helicase
VTASTPPTPETLASALDAIPPDMDRETWLRVGMALHSELPGEEGFALFDRFSSRGDSYNPRAVRDTWRSFKPGGRVRVGTLFQLAKAHGWRPEKTAPPKPPTAAELKARAEARRAAAERDERERADRQQAAAAEARRAWAAASETGHSPYLARKGVRAHGVRLTAGGAVLVPMHDAAGELVNVQTIKPERPADGAPEKLFVKGGCKTGAFHVIGTPEAAAWLLVAEGYATAASCFEATGRPVAVAFDAGNLAHVVRVLRGRWPAVRLAVCGDDDRATAERTGRNPGREKATAAARLVRGVAVFPEPLPEGASDFNDLHRAAGLDAVRERIESALAAADRAAADPEAAGPGRAKRPAKAPQAAGQGADSPAPPKAAPVARQRPARAGTAAGDDASEGAEARTDWRPGFRVDEAGTWFVPPAGEEGQEARPVRVCGPLRVEALARDAHDTGAALLLSFEAFGKPRRWLMPLAMLAGDGTAYRAELLNLGFVTPTDSKRRALLTAYLQASKPAELVRIVDRVGWHGRAYVLPRETLGDDGGERILFQSESGTEGAFSQRGTLAAWQERIAALCVGNSRLAFAASCAFAAPLLAWAHGTADPGGVHVVGDSSCGKTTALRVAASVWGGRDYLQRWRSTDNGVEAMAAAHSDALLILDEIAQMDGKAIGEAAYMLANGQGKQRAGRTGAARPRLTWRLLVLSAGEVGLADHMAEAGKRTRAGQELRMVDLPADAGRGLGVFEELHGHEGGGALAQHLARACESTYGTAGRAWLEWLTAHTEGLARTLRERMDPIEAALVPETAAGQVQRVGRRFALVAAAGELATAAGVTGWPEGTATEAARRCFNAWIEARPGGIGLTEDAQIMRQVRQWFGAHGEARFTDWSRAGDDHAPKTINRAGWRRAEKTTTGLDELIGWEWFVLPDVFRAEACKGYTERAVLKLLADRGHLVREGKHFASRASPPGADKVSVYRIKSSILGDLDE